ncbi:MULTISPECIES: DUF2254 domain-containing protein [Bradyrhizobium]|uniref:DUF2254 domain-containing protein n=1 Tax=Bradyrhizobium TaxID=374 RepID=UPI0004AEE0AA|nr:MULTISPECIES: DUF2254 domain-containing protein [unclassified Bradyrhizobium]MDA9420728.1 formate C-acetyltransferase glycine radical [Bradyrhizobium sp. CCBAU 53380]
MFTRLEKLLADLAETFWLVPMLMVFSSLLLAFALVHLDQSDSVSIPALQDWLYDGGATGARTLLGAVAGATIGVAGTVFSITIAALSLAAGQMGPRLLRNFTRDRGNQFTLGMLLGTFCYALVVLRSIRTEPEGGFVPHLALSVGIVLAFACVAMLVYFVGHVAGRINVETVVELVSQDLRAAIQQLTVMDPQPKSPPEEFWIGSLPLKATRRGYLQHLDEEGLATWAAKHRVTIRLLVGPGDYVFPGATVGLVTPPIDGAEAAIRNATALGASSSISSDLRFAVRQLVEVAVRALSPGINDPHTALAVLDRLGAALCDLVPLHLPTGISIRGGQPVLVVPLVQYEELLGTMFHMIRQSAGAQPVVSIRLIEVLTQVASCERDPARLLALSHHAALVLADACRTIAAPSDRDDVGRQYQSFTLMVRAGPMGRFTEQVPSSPGDNDAPTAIAESGASRSRR